MFVWCHLVLHQTHGKIPNESKLSPSPEQMEFCRNFLSKLNFTGILFGGLLARIAKYLLNGCPRQVKFHIHTVPGDDGRVTPTLNYLRHHHLYVSHCYHCTQGQGHQFLRCQGGNAGPNGRPLPTAKSMELKKSKVADSDIIANYFMAIPDDLFSNQPRGPLSQRSRYRYCLQCCPTLSGSFLTTEGHAN